MIRILALADDYWHPAATVREVGPVGGEGVHVRLGWWTAASGRRKTSPMPVVILSKSNNTTQEDKSPQVLAEVEQAFADYVRGGGGLLVTHSGTVYRDTETLRPLMVAPSCSIRRSVRSRTSPRQGMELTAGVTAFTMQDRHYHMVLEPGITDVFMTTTSNWDAARRDGREPRVRAGWRCSPRPRHNAAVWLAPPIRLC